MVHALLRGVQNSNRHMKDHACAEKVPPTEACCREHAPVCVQHRPPEANASGTSGVLLSILCAFSMQRSELQSVAVSKDMRGLAARMSTATCGRGTHKRPVVFASWRQGSHVNTVGRSAQQALVEKDGVGMKDSGPLCWARVQNQKC